MLSDNHSIDKCIEKFEIIGTEEYYSEKEIKEYKSYIDLVKIFSDNLKKE